MTDVLIGFGLGIIATGGFIWLGANVYAKGYEEGRKGE